MHTYSKLTFDQDATAVQWGNGKYLQQIDSEQMDKCMEKKMNLDPFVILHAN